jgi:N-acetylglutamate synthase-like GNAT family acetyltransferase
MILFLRRLGFNAKNEPAVKAQVRQNMCFCNDFSFHPQYGQN